MKKLVMLLLAAAGCSSAAKVDDTATVGTATCGSRLESRAYIVSRDSEDVTVLDLDCMAVVGTIRAGTSMAHMAELSVGYDKLFVTSTASEELVVIDAKALKVEARRNLGARPTHLTASPDGSTLAVMLEKENAVSFLDAKSLGEKERLTGFRGPHFLRYSKDGQTAYVANIRGNTITRVRMQDLTKLGEIGLDGLPEAEDALEDEGGFADAQIGNDGVLYAAHGGTGRILQYDTRTSTRLEQAPVVGAQPWIVFAEHPFVELATPPVVPSFGSATVSILDATRGVRAVVPGDRQAYGVNFSPLAPNLAFVMNRVRKDISVVDVTKGEVVRTLDVGGNTETASTTRDGRYIVATVSGANRVVVLDAATQEVVKTFEGVGVYPWSVVTPGGQNYCH